MKRIKLSSTRTRKGHRIQTVILAWVLSIAALILVFGIGVKAFLLLGKNSLYKGVEKTGTSLGEIAWEEEEGEQDIFTEPVDEEEVWQEGWIRYQGDIYQFNDNIITFLVLGIDQNNGKGIDLNKKYSAGQSDAIFLVVANPDTKTIKVIAINRDTMTDIKIPDVGGTGSDYYLQAQLTTQYGFGDGGAGSCELSKEAVSKLFYDLPIHGYVSFNMLGISELNDALGGVEVTMAEDYTSINKKWKAGETILLKGKDAYDFVQHRDTKEFESARGRLGRQKQYLSNFANLAIAQVKGDITLPLTLYNKMKKYLVTDISVDEISYLASEVTGYTFDGNDIYTLEGITAEVDGFEQFYPNKQALRSLIIETFYKKVE